MPDDYGHKSVLLTEVIESLSPLPGEVYVDLTIGRGGHAAKISQNIGPAGLIVGFDLDADNVATAMHRLGGIVLPLAIIKSLKNLTQLQDYIKIHSPNQPVNQPSAIGIPANYAEAPYILRQFGICADILLADLGFASNQMTDPERGFSFMHDGPLDMRLNPDQALTAAMLVNESTESELADLIYKYGEERSSRKISAAIVAERASEPIITTARLANVIRKVCSFRSPKHSKAKTKIDPATKTFQALRIAVNDELGNLEAICASIERIMTASDTSVDKNVQNLANDEHIRNQQASVNGECNSWVNPAGARVAFISFHSLEDRIIKRAFKNLISRGFAVPVNNRKKADPVCPAKLEIEQNPRARSAKLRAVKLNNDKITKR